MRMEVVTASCALGALLLAGHAVRRKSRWLRALHLPSSVIGGLIGWVFFATVELFGAGELADDWFADGWSVLPGFCTNIIFSSLFLGTPVPRPNVILASPRREHFLYGLIVVFGQYVVSALCTIVFRWFDPTLGAPFATVMPYGYAGGPVVAEAMRDLYVDSFEYADGYTLALLAATVGMFAGVIAGALLVNLSPIASKASGSSTTSATDVAEATERAERAGGPGDPASTCSSPARSWDAAAAAGQAGRNGEAGGGTGAGGGGVAAVRRRLHTVKAALLQLKETASDSDHYPARERPSAGEQTVSVESLDSFMFHLCLVSLVMLVGYLLRTPFVLAEELFPTGSFFEKSNLLSVLPLFLFCLLAGLGLQKLIDEHFTDARTRTSFVDRPTMERISNSAQDILIVVAISRLGRGGLPPGVHGLGHFLKVVFERGLPFIGVCLAGLLWGIASFWYVAPRLLPDFWAERALVEFGVSIGATSTGLLLLRMADPEGRTPVLRDFTFKQIFHVLITGGGFFDVLVPIPLTSATSSAWPLLITCVMIIGVLLMCHPESDRLIRAVYGTARTPAGRRVSQQRFVTSTTSTTSTTSLSAPTTSRAAAGLNCAEVSLTDVPLGRESEVTASAIP